MSQDVGRSSSLWTESDSDEEKWLQCHARLQLPSSGTVFVEEKRIALEEFLVSLCQILQSDLRVGDRPVEVKLRVVGTTLRLIGQHVEGLLNLQKHRAILLARSILELGLVRM